VKKQFAMSLFLIISTLSVDAQASSHVAADAYQQGDYQTAITLYEQQVARGERNGALYFNLGNAHYEAGHRGRALLNYQRAARYLPRDFNLNNNISRIRAERLNLTSDETDWLNMLAVITVDTLTIYELSLLVFGIWILFFGLLAVAIVLEKQPSEGRRILILSIGIILFIGFALLGSRIYVEAQRPSAVVISNATSVMSGPGQDYLNLYTIFEAAEVRILEEINNWVRFSLPDGQQGWIQAENVGYITK